jgi:phage-related protein
MDLLDYITIKNKFEILIQKTENKYFKKYNNDLEKINIDKLSKNKINDLKLSILKDNNDLSDKYKENYETLLDVLKTLNNAMLHFENLNKELRNQRNANNSLILDNGRLKNKINLLTKQIEDLKTELKQEF